MNRTIKFRAWDSDGKVMIYPSPHMNPLYLRPDGKLVEIDREGDEVPARGYAVLLSTGLADMNGRDIYEGDILKHHKYGGAHEVKWIAESAGFFVGGQSWPLTSLCCPSIEVTGNVYEVATDHKHDYRTVEGQSVPECACGAIRNYET